MQLIVAWVVSHTRLYDCKDGCAMREPNVHMVIGYLVVFKSVEYSFDM